MTRLSLLEWDEPETPVRTRSASKPRKPKPAKAKADPNRKSVRTDNPGEGKKFVFHGAFSKKEDAEAKKKCIPGSFIKPTKIRGQHRFSVVEKKT